MLRSVCLVSLALSKKPMITGRALGLSPAVFTVGCPAFGVRKSNSMSDALHV